jgi:flagella basal body P-ring formation protein FlgA
MSKKIIFAFIFSASLLFPALSDSGYGYARAVKKPNLKRMVIKSYISKIPLKFKKYFHFSNFAYNVPFKISAGELKTYSVKVEINNLKYSGYHTAVIKIADKNSGAVKGIDDITFKTEIYAPVAVASETIGKFQIIKPDDVKISYKNIPGLNDGYYLSGKKTAGREAKFFIAAGSALTNANTERKRIINFGDAVNIVYKRYGLILKTKGMALQAGALNSIIRVKNIESGAVLACIVKSDKVVAVR